MVPAASAADTPASSDAAANAATFGAWRGGRHRALRRSHSRESPDDGQDDERHERQIHAAFGAHLGGNRHDAGRRRERDEEPDAKETEHRPAAEGDEGHRQQRRDEHGGGQDVAERERHRPSVIEHQRPRPENETKIASDHRRLVQQVRPRADAGRKARRARPRTGCQQPGEDQPRCGQAGIEAPAFSNAFLNEPNTKMRSNRTTINGAVTIDSLHPIPSAHANTATSSHLRGRPPRPRARFRTESAGKTTPSSIRFAG